MITILKPNFEDYEAIVKLSDGFNGADLRNVCTEAGLFINSFVNLSLVLNKINTFFKVCSRFVRNEIL